MTIQEATDRLYALGNAWEQFKQVNDSRLSELERKGHADPLYLDHLHKISDVLDQQKQRLDRMETAVSRPGAEIKSSLGYRGEDQGEYKAAFDLYLRKGMDSALERLQTKSLSAGTDTAGGYLVPNQLADLILQIVNESSPMRALATVETISSDSLDLIEDTVDMGASWGDETTVRSAETSSATLGRNTIDTYEMFAQPQATQKLIDDASIDIEKWIATKVADKMARLEATAFIGGDGITQPKGILSYAAGTSWGQIQQVGSGSSATVTADSLINLYYSLKDDYARNATFLMHRTTVQAVRLLKEATTNQYLWQPGLAAGRPDTLLGVPVALAADMPTPAASSLSIAVGDFKRGYLIVDRLGIRTLRDPFTAKPFVKFYTTKRVGGEVVNYEAIKILKLV